MENDPRLQQQWTDLATPWIQEMRHGRNPHRVAILDPRVPNFIVSALTKQ